MSTGTAAQSLRSDPRGAKYRPWSRGGGGHSVELSSALSLIFRVRHYDPKHGGRVRVEDRLKLTWYRSIDRVGALTVSFDEPKGLAPEWPYTSFV